MGLRITAWLLCVSILGVWLPGELCRNQVFAGEKQENIWLEAKGESEDPESEGAEPESSKSEGIYAEPAPQLSESVQQLSVTVVIYFPMKALGFHSMDGHVARRTAG